jgi:hypothetical protein
MIVCLDFIACRRIVAVEQLRKMDASAHSKNRRIEEKPHFYSMGRKKAMIAFAVSIQIEAAAAGA